MLMRWPPRKRSASVSLIAVWDSSRVGCGLMEGPPRSGEPHVGQGETTAKRIGRIGAVLEHSRDPGLARDRRHDRRAPADRGLGGDPGLEARADDRLVH